MGRHTELTGQGVPAVKLPRPYTHTGKHRAEDNEATCPEGAGCAQHPLGHYRKTAERPPSPGYSFTLVEQPGGGA